MTYNIFIHNLATECNFVRFFHNLENFFQNYIEGFFDKKFSSGLQPVEIAKQIARRMEDGRSVGVRHIYVPNHYSVYLGQDDHERLQPYWPAIAEELAGHAAQHANQRGYTIVGKPIIDLFLDQALKPGKFRIESKFSEPIQAEEEKAKDVAAQDELSDTRVFNKVSSPPVNKFHIAGILTVIEGIDAGAVADIGVNRTNIGRREGNELPLTDMNTSRLHAYIVFEEGSHVIYDAKSLNGTYVNGHRVTRKRLADGDRIKLGNTTILYEVK
ncbi:MAG: DUF3662 domain-containing protein [Negativicutes bacterium]|nr:DUF3662 domain-containing protein [Negativicutes bacterium]